MKRARTVFFSGRYEAETPIPLEAYLKKNAAISGRSLRKYFFKGLVELNGKKAHSSATIRPGDNIRVFQMDEPIDTLTPENHPIEIIYENDQFLVINKPAMLAVHPSGAILSGTLANRVAYYFLEAGYRLKVRPVNRLDFGTSGLILFAKSTQSQEELSGAIQQHRIARIYYAVVAGLPSPTEGVIDLPIAQTGSKRFIAAHGQPAVTHYRVAENLNHHSLLELSLQTGRTHQIRLHLKHIGCPIVGDKQYGIRSPLIGRPALHAGKLIFNDPKFDVPELTAPLPEDLLNLLTVLKTTQRSE